MTQPQRDNRCHRRSHSALQRSGDRPDRADRMLNAGSYFDQPPAEGLWFHADPQRFCLPINGGALSIWRHSDSGSRDLGGRNGGRIAGGRRGIGFPRLRFGISRSRVDNTRSVPNRLAMAALS